MRVRDENKEQAIRQKAIEMIVESGLSGLSMQRLAKAAQVSPATIYIYFKDREDLILQVCIAEHQKMAVAMLKDFDPNMPFAEGLRVQWHNRAAFCQENPLHLFLLEHVRHSPLYEKAFDLMSKDFTRILGAFAQNAIQRGELVQIPIEVYWAVAFAPLYQLLKFHLHGKGVPLRKPFALTDEVLEQALQLVLKALKP